MRKAFAGDTCISEKTDNIDTNKCSGYNTKNNITGYNGGQNDNQREDIYDS